MWRWPDDLFAVTKTMGELFELVVTPFFLSFHTKLSFLFGGVITLFHCSIPVQGSQVTITPEKL
jgi:hypothetical protein